MGRIINLSERRSLRSPVKKHLLFYIHEKSKIHSSLLALDLLKVVDIQSPSELNSQLHFRKPDMVFVESDMRWGHPIQVIDELNRHLPCPIVLVCDRKRPQKNLIKQACSAGIFDVLFSPLLKDELAETLKVLLKLSTPTTVNR